MAKRTNIIRIMRQEIEKGNLFIISNGNIVSEDMLSNGIMDSYMKDLRAGKIDMNMSLNQYKEATLGQITKVSDLLDSIMELLGTPKEEEPTEENVSRETLEPAQEEETKEDTKPASKKSTSKGKVVKSSDKSK